LVYSAVTKYELPLEARALEQLKESAENNVRNMLMLFSLLQHLSSVLKSCSIPYITVKGPALSVQLYGTITMRQSRDIDILIPAERATDAIHVLLANGYEPDKKSLNITSGYQRFSRLYRNAGLRHKGSGRMIELHWRLFDGTKEPAWFDLQEPVVLEKETFQGLTAQANLLYLSVHGHHHRWSELGWITDIHLLNNKISPDIAVWDKKLYQRRIQSARDIAAAVYSKQPVPSTVMIKYITRRITRKKTTGTAEKIEKFLFLIVSGDFLSQFRLMRMVINRYFDKIRQHFYLKKPHY